MLFAFLIASMASSSVGLAQKTLADDTPNPAAVQFRNLRTSGSIVCGEINAPNENGGFDGFRKFAFHSPRKYVLTYGMHFIWLDGTEAAMTESLWDKVLHAGVDGGESVRQLTLAEEHGKVLFAPCAR